MAAPTASSTPDYVFTRDVLDDNRINLQHYLWVQLYNYQIHPKVSLDLSTARIADIGTGTGVWLLDLAAKLPETVELDGLDISFNAAPPAQTLPSNVSFYEWDIRKPVPQELKGVYDLVHIRTFSFVLQEDELPLVLEHLLDLLKPGGYLQWGEPDVASFRIETAHPNVQTTALRQLLQISQPRDARLSPKWVSRLPDHFTDAGLVECDRDVREMTPAMAYLMHECGLVIHELLARQSGNGELTRAVGEVLPKAVEETKAGAWWAFTRWTIVGRKKEA